MAPHFDDSDDNWSDSDEEGASDVKTSVLLGVPDGPVDTPSDLRDAAVSRIGGHPVRYLLVYSEYTCLTIVKAFLTSAEPPFQSSQCKICSDPMELLVQMWCPFEDSPMDRALYIWGCASSQCQAKPGRCVDQLCHQAPFLNLINLISIRAWRGLRFNETYADKLAAKSARQQEKNKVKEQINTNSIAGKANPFSVRMVSSEHILDLTLSIQMGASAPPNPFGLGDQIFGKDLDDPSSKSIGDTDEDGASDDESDASLDESIVTALASLPLDDSVWKAAPSYPPLYLSTLGEYLPPQPKAKLPPGVQVTDPDHENSRKDAKDISWAMEPYENSLDVDQVFERFAKRVGYEGEQCVR
jgi:pre-rRNA-processing protein TSR4